MEVSESPFKVPGAGEDSSKKPFDDLVRIKVGDEKYTISARLIEKFPESRLALLLHSEADDFVDDDDLTIYDDGTFFFDQDAKYFEYVLQFYRKERLPDGMKITPLFRDIWINTWKMPEEALDDGGDDILWSDSGPSSAEEEEDEEEDYSIDIGSSSENDANEEDKHEDAQMSVEGGSSQHDPDSGVSFWAADDPNKPEKWSHFGQVETLFDEEPHVSPRESQEEEEEYDYDEEGSILSLSKEFPSDEEFDEDEDDSEEQDDRMDIDAEPSDAAPISKKWKNRKVENGSDRGSRDGEDGEEDEEEEIDADYNAPDGDDEEEAEGDGIEEEAADEGGDAVMDEDDGEDEGDTSHHDVDLGMMPSSPTTDGVTFRFSNQDPRDVRAAIAKDSLGRPRDPEVIDRVMELIEQEKRQILKKNLLQNRGALVKRTNIDEKRLIGHYSKLVRIIEASLDAAKDRQDKIDVDKINTGFWTMILEQIVADEPLPSDEAVELIQLEVMQERAAAEATPEPDLNATSGAQESPQPPKKRRRPRNEDDYDDGSDEYDFDDGFLAPDDDEEEQDTDQPDFVMKGYSGFNLRPTGDGARKESLPIPIDDDAMGADDDLEQEREEIAARQQRKKQKKPDIAPSITMLNSVSDVIAIDAEEDERQTLAILADNEIASATQKIETFLDVGSSSSPPSRNQIRELQESLEIIARAGRPESAAPTTDGLVQAAIYFRKLYNELPSIVEDPSDILKKIMASNARTPYTANSTKPSPKEMREEHRKRQREEQEVYEVDDMDIDTQNDYVDEFHPPAKRRKVFPLAAPKRGVPANATRTAISDPFFDDGSEATKLAREKEKAARSYMDDLNASMSVTDSQPASDGFEIGESPKTGKKVYLHPTLTQKLQDHQKEAVRLMWARCIGFSEEGTGFILAHCMGLGKTISAFALVATFLRNPYSWAGCPAKGRKAVIIAPSSLMMNWRREIREWSAGGVFEHQKVTVVTKHSDEISIEKWCKNGGLLLINIEVLASKPDKSSRPELIEKVFEQAHLAVLDECHKFIAKEDSQKRVRLCQFKTNRRIGLSGSPIQNDIVEIFEIMSWIVPGVLGSERGPFVARFVEPIERGLDPEATPARRRTMQLKLQILKNELAPIICRRSPKFLASILTVSKAEFIVRTRASTLQQELLEEFSKTKNGIFEATNAVRQIPGLPEAFYEYSVQRYLSSKDKNPARAESSLQVIRSFDKIFSKYDLHWKAWDLAETTESKAGKMRLSAEIAMATSPKFQCLLAIIREASKTQDKVVVFTCWKETHNLLLILLGKAGVIADGFSGDDNHTDRAERVQAFKADSLTQVFVVTTNAGAHGINLIAANRVVLFEPVWNPATEVQAAFRVFRIGQKKDVCIYHFINTATGERYVEATSLYKKKLSVRFLDDIHSKMKSEVKEKKLSVKTLLQVDPQLVQDHTLPGSPPSPIEVYSDAVLNKIIAKPEIGRWIHTVQPSELLIADDADEIIPDDVRTDAASKKVVDMLNEAPNLDEERPKRGRPKKGSVPVFNPSSPGADADVEILPQFQIRAPSSPQRPNPTIVKKRVDSPRSSDSDKDGVLGTPHISSIFASKDEPILVSDDEESN